MEAGLTDLSGKVVLVTGASSGIGANIASFLHDEGARVIMTGRDPDRLKSIASKSGIPRDFVIAADISARLQDLLDGLDKLPSPDVVVHSAGMARNTPFLDVTESDYDAVFDVNMRATYFLTQAMVRNWLKKGKVGTVLTISSQMGHVGGPNRSVYSASKHAIEGMTKALTVEFAPLGFRFLTLCPTFVDTPLARQTLADPELCAWVDRSIPVGRLVTTAEVAATVAFLISDAASMITGSSVMLDGGWTAA